MMGQGRPAAPSLTGTQLPRGVPRTPADECGECGGLLPDGHGPLLGTLCSPAAQLSMGSTSCLTCPGRGFTAPVLPPGPRVSPGLPSGTDWWPGGVPGSRVPMSPGRNPCWHAAPSRPCLAVWGPPTGMQCRQPACVPRSSTMSLPSSASACSGVSSWLLETAGELGSGGVGGVPLGTLEPG